MKEKDIMNAFFRLILSMCFLICVFFADISSAQKPDMTGPDVYKMFDFDYAYHLVPKIKGENSDLILYLKVPFIKLSFTKYEDIFRAEYEVTVEVRDKDRELIQGKSWIETVQTKFYDETVNQEISHLTKELLPLTSGNFTLTVSIVDNETKTRIAKSKNLQVNKQNDSKFRTSNILFADYIDERSGKVLDFLPSFSNALNKNKANYYTVFDLVPSGNDEEYNIEVELKTNERRDNKTIFKNDFKKENTGEIIKIATNLKEKDLNSGPYTITYKISSGWSNSKTISKDFVLTWYGAPTSEGELDTALEQMKYAFKETVPGNFKELNHQNKLTLFNTIWKQRDPTPETPRNELRDEYFRRVRYSNSQFSFFNEGWKSDRGMIYILFGAPTEILDINYSLASYPMKYWSYIRHNMVFQFHDIHSIGDYRLLFPYDYDIWTRPIR
ncbi:GWxTD domain-containing protein [candidate division KSB1 bacterium]